MLFIKDIIKSDDINSVQDFINDFDSDFDVNTFEDAQDISNASKYITSLVSSCYQKSIEDIENTHVGNSIKRKRNLKQIMKESFFYGANRFGNNFIA